MFIENKIDRYYIIEKYTAGIILYGWEVRSIKRFNFLEIENSYLINIKNEIFLKNSFINKNDKYLKVDEKRNRKLLLNKYEINLIKKKIKKFKIIPISFFLKKKIIKLNIGFILKKNKNENFKKK